MYLVLVRHGESIWNKENKFTGWTDVELSEKGIEDAKRAGVLLKKSKIEFGIAYTSVLTRAKDTLKYIKEEMGCDIRVKETYKLNERHYGKLQGLNKDKTKEIYGEEQVMKWRRSYDVKPPELTIDDPRFPGNDPKYKDVLKFELPLSESLKDTYNRVVEFYKSEISTFLKLEENVLIVAHGNSLRALVKYLENISDEEIPSLEIPLSVPIVYDLDKNLNIIKKTIL